MNNNIIKSLRRTLLCTVAAAAVTIGFTACADDAFTTQNTTAPANGYKVIIPAGIGGGDTRAIAYNETENRYDATFETTDRIIVYDVNKKALGIKTTEWGWNDAYLNPDANGKTANLCGEINAFRTVDSWEVVAPEVDDELMLFYNTGGTGLGYYRNYSGDDYYFTDIADYALAPVKISSIDEDGVIRTSEASFVNQQSIYRINFSGIESGVKIKKIDIQSAKNQLVTYYLPFDKDNNPREDFGVVSYIYEEEGIDQHELTFMLRYSDNPNNYYSDNPSTSGDVFSFTAVGDNGHYYMGKKEVTGDLKNGLYYQADVSMTDGGSAMKVTNTTTGETLESSAYYQVYTNDADYLAENNGYGTCIEWYGGNDDNHTLTIKNLTIENSGDKAIAVKHGDGADNTKVVHKLVLDGVNTLSVTGNQNSLTVQDNCSLIISSSSSGTGRLILKANNIGLSLWDNANVTIESGEVTVDGRLGINYTSSCIITKSGKLRVLTEQLNSTAGIKAASGYILNTTKEGDYTVYTVSPAPDPIALSAVTTDDIGKIIGSDGNVYVPNYSLSDNIRPVGMIASISSTGHGLAIAMEAIRKNSDDYRNGFSWDNSGEANDGKTATEIFQNWATNNEVSFGTWRIPSKSDCQDMILGCRIDGDATVASDENMTSNGFGTKLVAAGICTDDYFYFGTWTSTSGQDGEIYLGTNKSENGSFVAGFYNYSFSTTTTIFPVLEF